MKIISVCWILYIASGRQNDDALYTRNRRIYIYHYIQGVWYTHIYALSSLSFLFDLFSEGHLSSLSGCFCFSCIRNSGAWVGLTGESLWVADSFQIYICARLHQRRKCTNTLYIRSARQFSLLRHFRRRCLENSQFIHNLKTLISVYMAV